MGKYNSSNIPILMVQCPYCWEFYDSELIENHLDISHSSESMTYYDLDLLEIDGTTYYYKLRPDNVAKEYYSKKGIAVSLTKYNDFVELIDPGKFAKLYDAESKLNVGKNFIFFTCENIAFGLDKINFIQNNYKYPHIVFIGVTEKWNISKDTFLKKHFNNSYQFYLNEGKFNLHKSPGYYELLDLFDNHLEVTELGDNSDFEIIETGTSTNFEIINRPLFRIYDNAYLKFLFELHAPEYKLIPIIENNNKKKEPSIIFRFKTKTDKILVVWENYTPGRATHIFVDTGENIEKIKYYIAEKNRSNKRKLLYSTKTDKIKNNLGYLKAIRHTITSKFKKQIFELIEEN